MKAYLTLMQIFGNYLITNGISAIKYFSVPDFLEKIFGEEFVRTQYILDVSKKLMRNSFHLGNAHSKHV
ncbi:MAG: hypothetical protein LBH08_02225 [Puniceicoccales bacterium]|jgi:hypothetical protein|nr:hypothetical protein [Puniceicoccales bacterium]